MRQIWMASLLVASAAAWGQSESIRVPQARQQQKQKQQQQQQGQSPYRAFVADGLTTFLEEVPTPASFYDKEVCAEPTIGGDSGETAIVVDQIVNLGQKVWNVVEKGKPVLESKYTYANALPQGVRSSGELEGWSSLQAKSFRLHAKNGFGITVYDVTYTLAHRYNGSVGGKGRYLDAVTVLPQNVSLMWGYKMNIGANVISTVNIGSKAEPVSGMTLELLIKISTVMKETEIRGLYDFHGNDAKVVVVQ
jgi:hypothetical protein